MSETSDRTRFDELTLRSFKDLAAQGIMTTDAELRIRGWNRWLETQSGKTAAEMIGRGLLEAFPELVERGLDRFYHEALSGEVRVLSHGIHKYLLKFGPAVAGSALDAMRQSVRIVPLVDGETVVGTLTVIDDVTERMERETQLKEQLREREELLASEQRARQEAEEATRAAEEATRAKDLFLANVSHELRNPLNAMYGWTQLLRARPDDAEMLERGLDTLDANVRAQTKLIEDLLDVSRIVSGQMRLDVRPLDLAEVVRGAAESVRPAAEAKQIHLDIVLDPAAGPSTGDPDRLRQAAFNLLTNAIKFTPKGGHVRVELRRVDSSVDLTVSDTGQGIAGEFLPHVFERFLKAQQGGPRATTGLGLGLAIVRHIAELHGGTVNVESAGVGQGAAFTLRLPAAVVDHRGETERAHPTAGGDPSRFAIPSLAAVRVLVVDDNPDATMLLGASLEMYGAEVRTSGTAEEALAVLTSWRPHVVVSDIGMPGEDGLSLIRRIRSLEPERGSQTPAVAVTAFGRPEDRARSLLAGFQQHLVKPIEPRELCAVIAALSGRTGA